MNNTTELDNRTHDLVAVKRSVQASAASVVGVVSKTSPNRRQKNGNSTQNKKPTEMNDDEGEDPERQENEGDENGNGDAAQQDDVTNLENMGEESLVGDEEEPERQENEGDENGNDDTVQQDDATNLEDMEVESQVGDEEEMFYGLEVEDYTEG